MSNLTDYLGAYYGLGCFSTGYYLVRVRLGADIRETGSGMTIILLAPLVAYLMRLPWQFALSLAGVAMLLIFAHRDNIRQRFRDERTPFPPTPARGE